MRVQVLAAPHTGKTWLCNQLQNHRIHAIDLDHLLNWAISTLGYSKRHLSIRGTPKWLQRAKKLALLHLPLNAQVYIGQSIDLPFRPDALFFITIDNFELVYRRIFEPFLPKHLLHYPVQILVNILATFPMQTKEIMFFETFCMRYTFLKQSSPLRTIFLNINMLLQHLLFSYTTLTPQCVPLQSIHAPNYSTHRQIRVP